MSDARAPEPSAPPDRTLAHAPLPAEDGPPGHPPLARIGAHYFALFAMVAGWMAYFQLYLRARGFEPQQVGVLLACADLFGIAGPLLIGHLADRLGRPRRLLLAAVAVFGAALIPVNHVSTLLAALPLAAVLGYAYRSLIPVTDALVSSELTDPAHQYGRVRVLGSVGFISLLLAVRVLRLVDTTSSTQILLMMLTTVALCLATAVLLPPGRLPRRQARAVGRVEASEPPRPFPRLFWLWLGLIFLAQIGMSLYYTFFSLYLKEAVGLPNGTWIWAVGPAAEMPVLFFGGRLVRRFGLPALMIAATAGMALRLTICGLLPTPWAVIPAQALHALTFGVFHTSSIEFVRRQAPAGRRGLAMALYGAVGLSLPSLVGAAIGGFVIAEIGYANTFAVYALPPAISATCLALLYRRFRAA